MINVNAADAAQFPSTLMYSKIILICPHPPDFSGLVWKMQEITMGRYVK